MAAASSLFVDTSGWADPVLRNTPDHARMTAVYKEAIARKRPLVTTNYVLAALVALLTARARAPRMQLLAYWREIRGLPRLHVVHIDPALGAEAWSLLERSTDKDWSLVDAASFTVMRRLGLTEAFTSDRHFAQAVFTCVPSL